MSDRLAITQELTSDPGRRGSKDVWPSQFRTWCRPDLAVGLYPFESRWIDVDGTESTMLMKDRGRSCFCSTAMEAGPFSIGT